MTTNQLKEIIKKAEGMKYKHNHTARFRYGIDNGHEFCEYCSENEGIDKVITLLKKYER